MISVLRWSKQETFRRWNLRFQSAKKTRLPLRARGGGGFPHRRAHDGVLVFPAAASDGDVTQRASFGPVTAASLAEMARLGEIVVIIVTELRVGRITARAP
nr:hypothetical protein PanWU01x14_251760 [Ipomoea batatas]